MPFAIIDKVVEKKLRSLFHHRVAFAAKETAIQTIEVVLPEVQRQPRAPHWPHAYVAVIDGCSVSPGVQIVMEHKPSRSVHLFCRFAAARNIRLNQVEKWP